MIYESYPAGEDLMVFLHREPQPQTRWKHENTTYTVISDNEFHLNTFSLEGSIHVFPFQGRMIECELQFSGEGKYGGPIVVYFGDDGKFWMRPCFEFHRDFVKEDI